MAVRLRQKLSLGIADHPHLFYPVMRRRAKYNGVLIGDHTELVIEGFPRSGNTFAVAALQFAQPHPVVIARHTHAAAQVIEGVRRRLPTLLLIRDPRDACMSLVIRERAVSLELALRRYVRFHRRLAPFWRGYVVATFDQVTSDYSQVIERLNRRCNIQFVLFDHTPQNCETVFGIVEEMERDACNGMLYETRVARPSAVREAIKEGLAAGFEDGANQALLADCNSLHREFQAMSRE